MEPNKKNLIIRLIAGILVVAIVVTIVVDGLTAGVITGKWIKSESSSTQADTVSKTGLSEAEVKKVCDAVESYFTKQEQFQSTTMDVDLSADELKKVLDYLKEELETVDKEDAQARKQILSYMGYVCVLLEDNTSAQDYFEQVIELDKDDDTACLILGEIYLENGNSKAEALIDKFVTADLKDPTRASTVAVLYFYNNNYDLSEKYAQKAIDGGESNMDTWNCLAFSKFTQEDYDAASEYFAKAAENCNKEEPFSTCSLAETYSYKGIADMARGEFLPAIEAFGKAIENDYSGSDVYYNRAISYLNLGDYANANADFSKVLEINDDEELVKSAEEITNALLGN